MGKIGGVTKLAGIYWSYAFALWEQSSNCGGAAQKTVQLGTAQKFTDSDQCSLSQQLFTFPANATIFITAFDGTADTFSYSTYQCASASAAAKSCYQDYSVGCSKLVSASGKVGVCTQLGASASVMLTHTVSNDFYGILFGSLGAAAVLFLCAAWQRGWRLRGGRCVKVDLEAEAEAEYEAEKKRRAELQASFDRAEKNGLTTRVHNPAASFAR